MVEAMFERSPGFFKEFQKAFKFSVCDEKPELNGVKFYAVCVHFENPFCTLKTNHYQVLVDTSDVTKSSDKSKIKKSYTVPCLYTTFKILFANSNTLELNGEIFQKLVLAVEYNKNLSIDSHSIQKLLPNFSNVAANQKGNNNSNVTLNEDNRRRLQQGSSVQFQLHQNSLQNCITKSNNQQSQTDSFASESLKRFQNILSGPHSGAFCQIMDIFLSGYGNLLVDTDVLFVRIVYEEKIKF